VDIYPATPENSAFVFLLEQFSQPYRLAIEAEALTDETAQKILAKTYAGSIIVGSPTPHLAKMDAAGWEAWLLADEDKFEQIRDVATSPYDWRGMTESGS
jgi:hypothetical protein